jgi:hypothetical protein
MSYNGWGVPDSLPPGYGAEEPSSTPRRATDLKSIAQHQERMRQVQAQPQRRQRQRGPQRGPCSPAAMQAMQQAYGDLGPPDMTNIDSEYGNLWSWLGIDRDSKRERQARKAGFLLPDGTTGDVAAWTQATGGLRYDIKAAEKARAAESPEAAEAASVKSFEDQLMAQARGKKTVRPGMGSKQNPDPHVTEAQNLLLASGYDLGSSGADGIYVSRSRGKKTGKAIRDFQGKAGLTATGTVDVNTWFQLLRKTSRMAGPSAAPGSSALTTMFTGSPAGETAPGVSQAGMFDPTAWMAQLTAAISPGGGEEEGDYDEEKAGPNWLVIGGVSALVVALVGGVWYATRDEEGE